MIYRITTIADLPEWVHTYFPDVVRRFEEAIAANRRYVTAISSHVANVHRGGTFFFEPAAPPAPPSEPPAMPSPPAPSPILPPIVPPAIKIPGDEGELLVSDGNGGVDALAIDEGDEGKVATVVGGKMALAPLPSGSQIPAGNENDVVGLDGSGGLKSLGPMPEIPDPLEVSGTGLVAVTSGTINSSALGGSNGQWLTWNNGPTWANVPGTNGQVFYRSNGTWATHSGFTYDGAGTAVLSTALQVPFVRGASALTLGVGSTPYLALASSLLQALAPIGGGNGSPLRARTVSVTVSQPSTLLNATQNECLGIYLTGSGEASVFASSQDGALYGVYNATSGPILWSAPGDASTVFIPPDQGCIVMRLGGAYRALSILPTE